MAVAAAIEELIRGKATCSKAMTGMCIDTFGVTEGLVIRMSRSEPSVLAWIFNGHLSSYIKNPLHFLWVEFQDLSSGTIQCQHFPKVFYSKLS